MSNIDVVCSEYCTLSICFTLEHTCCRP